MTSNEAEKGGLALEVIGRLCSDVEPLEQRLRRCSTRSLGARPDFYLISAVNFTDMLIPHRDERAHNHGRDDVILGTAWAESFESAQAP